MKHMLQRVVSWAVAASWTLAVVLLLGALLLPPRPAFAQSLTCQSFYTGAKCGYTETCVEWKWVSFTLGGTSTGANLGWTYVCAKKVYEDIYKWAPMDDYTECAVCHQSGGGGGSGGSVESDPGAEDWCSDTDRALSTPHLCDGDVTT